MTNPVGGPTPPESPRSTRGVHGPDGGKFQKEMRKVEEVEKVSESELDKQRKRAFKKPADEEGEEIEARAPTPFETEFHVPRAPVGFSELEASGVKGAMPSSSPLEKAPESLPPPEELPESEQFWEGYELPDQPPESAQFEEQNFRKKTELSPEVKKQQLLILEEKKRREMKAGQEKAAIKEASSRQKEISASEGALAPERRVALSKKEMAKRGLPPGAKERMKEMPSASEKEEIEMPLPMEEGGVEEKARYPYAETPALSEQLREEKEREKKKTKEAKVPVQPPDPLPPACQRIAAAAQTSASPFLNAQTAELYLQMVGTMVFMSSSKGGISLTEVTLNSPAFRDSVLFNSVITIEKYATAPDSFNIRLSGTPEAVQIFNNNMTSLTSAFTAAYEDRRVSFRIGRIETELAPNRPLIRRKKEGGSNENLSER